MKGCSPDRSGSLHPINRPTQETPEDEPAHGKEHSVEYVIIFLNNNYSIPENAQRMPKYPPRIEDFPVIGILCTQLQVRYDGQPAFVLST